MTKYLLFPFILLAGCGMQPHPLENSQSHSTPSTPQQDHDFAAWCADWSLVCPGGEPTPFPSEEDQWEKDAWRAMGRLAATALFSETTFDIPASEIENPLFSDLFAHLQLGDWYQFFVDRVEQRKLSRIFVNKSGSLNISFQGSQQYYNRSGLGMRLDAGVALTPTSIGSLNVVGVALSDAWGEIVKNINAIDFGKNVSQLQLSEGYRVNSVHTSFVLDDLVGQTPDQSPPEDMDVLGLIKFLAPLVDWARAQGIGLDLQRTFFEEALRAYKIMAKPPHNPTVINTLRKASSLLSGGRNALDASLLSGQQLKCKLESQRAVTINISGSFGLRSIARKNAETVEIRAYGINAKVLGFKLKLKRMDLTKDSVTLYDIPIIGEFTMPISNDDITKINCQ